MHLCIICKYMNSCTTSSVLIAVTSMCVRLILVHYVWFVFSLTLNMLVATLSSLVIDATKNILNLNLNLKAITISLFRGQGIRCLYHEYLPEIQVCMTARPTDKMSNSYSNIRHSTIVSLHHANRKSSPVWFRPAGMIWKNLSCLCGF